MSSAPILPLSDPGKFYLEALRRMRRCRWTEEYIEQAFREGRMKGTCHLGIGQEGVAVGVAMALHPGDLVISGHRGHNHLLAMGGDPGRLLDELAGKPSGYSGGRGGSQHLFAPEIGFLGTNGITAGGLPVGCGAAFALKYQGKKNILVAFHGDGATAQGTWHESLNLATVLGLPVLFLCENNRYAMSMPLSKTVAGGNIAARSTAYGIPGSSVEGNEVAAVTTMVSAMREQILHDQRPALLVADTYRFCGHSRSDQKVYRTREEEERWRERDPIQLCRKRLLELKFPPETLAKNEAAWEAEFKTIQAQHAVGEEGKI